MPSARARQPIDYFQDARQFGHTPVGGPRSALRLRWPTGGAARDLRAAVLQHCIVAASADALRRRPRRSSMAKIAAGGRVDLAHLRMAWRGEAYMQMPEVATLASVAPDALPDPAWVHSMVTGATIVFRSQIIASGRGLPGVLAALSADQIAGEEVVAALQGWVAVEVLPGEEEANERLAAAAGPLLDQSARDQARAAGLPFKGIGRRDRIVIRAVNAHAPAGIDGCYDPKGPILVGHLPGDWIETVHDRGWAVLDGHFIVEITSTRNGRPHTVRAVRLYPETPEDPEGEWLYSADVASVSGPENRPTLTFTEPVRRQR